ncbi:MAG: hypothetical protein DRJ45_07280 [Thermoprotei archaeon]|nr:MAG: hypothetical protein DRJ45_07280 [Thermoprotei archaeon]
MWIANRKRLEFTNVQTGAKILISNEEIILWDAPQSGASWHIAKVNGHDDAMKKYAEILEILQLKQLLLVEYEE